MISPVIYFLGLELKHIAGTGHYAEVTSFAALPVDINGSYNFCHIIQRLIKKMRSWGGILKNLIENIIFQHKFREKYLFNGVFNKTLTICTLIIHLCNIF